jgi:putative glutamine transport system permease protein
MKELFTMSNVLFILQGLKMTLYISLVSILLSILLGTILGVLRTFAGGVFKLAATIYIEVVRNIPNLLWIYVVFVVFKLKSVEAGVVSFTIFTSAALGEIVRGGLNSVGAGQWEAARSQGFSTIQILWYIVLPQALRNMIPALVSQFVTVVKDTSFLWSVVAIQELTGKVTILMGRYYQVSQVFVLYLVLALIYFVINYTLSHFSRKLQEKLTY